MKEGKEGGGEKKKKKKIHHNTGGGEGGGGGGRGGGGGHHVLARKNSGNHDMRGWVGSGPVWTDEDISCPPSGFEPRTAIGSVNRMSQFKCSSVTTSAPNSKYWSCRYFILLPCD